MLDARPALAQMARPRPVAAAHSTSMYTVALLTAGIHEPSNTSALAADIGAATVAAAGILGLRVGTRTIEIRQLAADLSVAAIGGAPPPALRMAIESVTSADALVAVTPVFAASYTGLFKSFFDVLDPGCLTEMPTVIGATGGSVRHSLVIDYALRPLLAYFRAAVVPTGVFMSPGDADGADLALRLRDRIARAGTELAGALAARSARLAPRTERLRP